MPERNWFGHAETLKSFLSCTTRCRSDAGKASAKTTKLDRMHIALILKLLVGISLIAGLQACAVVTVADAAVTVVATGVKVTAKAVGAVADVVIPDSGD